MTDNHREFQYVQADNNSKPKQEAQTEEKRQGIQRLTDLLSKLRPKKADQLQREQQEQDRKLVELEAFHTLKDALELIKNNPNFKKESVESNLSSTKVFINDENTERIKLEISSRGDSNHYFIILRRSSTSGGVKLTPNDTGTYYDERIEWRIDTSQRKGSKDTMPEEIMEGDNIQLVNAVGMQHHDAKIRMSDTELASGRSFHTNSHEEFKTFSKRIIDRIPKTIKPI